MIGLFSLPVIVGCIRRPLGDRAPKWRGVRSTIVAVAGLPLFILALRAAEWPSGGGGIVLKAGLRMGVLGSSFILTVSYLGLAAAILFSMRSATNAILAVTFFAPLLVVTPMDQKYLEPALIVALFLFADTRTSKIVFNKRVLIFNFVFSALFWLLLSHIMDVDCGTAIARPCRVRVDEYKVEIWRYRLFAAVHPPVPDCRSNVQG